MNKTINVSLLDFGWFFFVYLLIVFFFNPSSGWTALAFFIYSAWFVSISFLTVTITLFILHFQRRKRIYFQTKLLSLVILCQIIFYAFMAGDCGDVACTVGITFIERATNTNLFGSFDPIFISQIFGILYILFYLLFVFKSLKSAK